MMSDVQSPHEAAQQITGCVRAPFNPYVEPRCAKHSMPGVTGWPCDEMERVTAFLAARDQAIRADEARTCSLLVLGCTPERAHYVLDQRAAGHRTTDTKEAQR